jgi:hypothetical protein
MYRKYLFNIISRKTKFCVLIRLRSPDLLRPVSAFTGINSIQFHLCLFVQYFPARLSEYFWSDSVLTGLFGTQSKPCMGSGIIKGVGPSTTLVRPGWKQPDIPVEVDTARLETSQFKNDLQNMYYYTVLP